MCRLFGFHSQTKDQVHHLLIEAENALMVQSKNHPDGWGIAYYLKGLPHLHKSLAAANQDQVFRKLCRSLRSNTVIAHVRSATQGELSLLNCHPFQHGQWIMAHNGDLPHFKDLHSQLTFGIDQELLANIFGSTDSEVYFAIILQELARLDMINHKAPNLQKCALAIRKGIEKIHKIYQNSNIKEEPSLNITLTNGQVMLGFRTGRDLGYSTNLGEDSPTKEGQKLEHLLLSSEPLVNQAYWHSFEPGELIGVDHELRFFKEL